MLYNLIMKKLLILLTLSIFFLSGCGIYNLNCFTLPDDAEFLALVQGLDTPQKIGDYMIDNFESEEHPYISLTPYQLYLTKKGDCNDMAVFAQYTANYHGYETYQILMLYPKPIYSVDTWHAIAIYKENNYYTFSENQFYNPYGQYYVSFAGIMQLFNGWSKYIVYDYNMNIIETIHNN
jgi:hypothetical protein